MPSNRENKGKKGTKGANYDEPSGVRTSSAGPTGTIGNLNDAGHDGGVGTRGNRQSGGASRQGEPPSDPGLLKDDELRKR